jgi:hypothetical protein
MLYTGLGVVNRAQHEWFGEMLHDRIMAPWSCAVVTARCS